MLLPTPTVEDAAAITAIQQLSVSYAEAISRGDVHEAVQTYAPDGALLSPTTEPAVGRDAIEALITKATASFELCFQTVHQGLVRVDGRRARARFPITEWTRGTDAPTGKLFLGIYEDEVVLLDEGWRFATRKLVPRTLA